MVITIFQVVLIAEINVIWIRAVLFVLVVYPLAGVPCYVSIVVMCRMGFASASLVSQVGGRLLGPIFVVVSVDVVNPVVVSNPRVQFIKQCLDLLPTKSLSSN